MLKELENPALNSVRLFERLKLVNGQPAHLKCAEVNGQSYIITGSLLKTVWLEDEWFEDVRDPAATIKGLSNHKPVHADICTFWQRIPETKPKYPYHFEWESIAVLPISSYDEWFNKQISSRTRNQIRKGTKAGIDVRECEYDDEFVTGMTEIFNESPVRQGRKFWHFGKDVETVRRQFSEYLFRETLIGAFFEGKMIGFMMVGDAGNYAITGQIISKIEHRDKNTNNLLIAKACEVCQKKKLPFLVYLYWTADSLAEFKRRCGFAEVRVPRYFVPLTTKGNLAMKLGVHRGWKAMMPAQVIGPLKKLRRSWNNYAQKSESGA